MKKFILSLVALVCATITYAQSSLLATLSHDGTISTYYGANAFRDAMAAATDGDAITLSSGRFQAANITKAITLRGAGIRFSNDSIHSQEQTIIGGSFELNLTDSISHRLVVEGIYFNGTITYKGNIKNALFMKNCFYGFSKAGGGTITNGTFIHCRIAKCFYLSDLSYVTFVNSIVTNPLNDVSSSNFQFDNCVIHFATEQISGFGQTGSEYIYPYSVKNSMFENCVITAKSHDGNFGNGYHNEISSTCNAINCLGSTPYHKGLFNAVIPNTTNHDITNISDIFANGSNTYSDNAKYILTDDAKTKYPGTDGKEVGIYGGNLPYEEIVTSPRITKCNVAAKSTADGKLSVDIEVKAAEY